MKDITNTHPRYDAYIGYWTKARDFFEGEDQVKAKAEKYLPKSNDDPQPGEVDKYKNYKDRSFFYEATPRTVEGLIGLATHKPPTITMSTSMQHPDEYMPGDTTVEVMIQDITRENVITARQGLLVDRKVGENTTPYIVQYTAEQIINWHYEDDVLVFVVLQEMYNEYDPNDPYNTSEGLQYRELRMVEGVYNQIIWRKVDGKFVAGEPIIPNKRGVPFDHIPFTFTSKAKLGNCIDKSPIQGMVNANCHHYQLSADYAHALHYVAMPTPFFSGVDDTDGDVTLGPDVCIKAADPNAKATMLEVKGQGIPSIKSALNDIEDHMAHLGTRLLQSRKSGIESAEAIRLAQTAETSSLMAVVMVAEQALQAAFDEITEWEGISTQVVVELNKDFIDVTLQPNDINALVKAYQAKTMSIETLIYNLQRGELLPEDRTIEDEIELIEQSEESDTQPVIDQPVEDDDQIEDESVTQ